MLYALIGLLKDGAKGVPPSVQLQTSDFIGQPLTPVQSAGPLCNESGRRAGVLMIFEAENWAAAQSLAEASPYLEAGLIGPPQLYEYRNEVG
jgi:hypothetical protein